jgi:hypothetical protein
MDLKQGERAVVAVRQAMRSFGCEDSDPLIRLGITFLLSTQDPDGSWDKASEDLYTVYHATMVGVQVGHTAHRSLRTLERGGLSLTRGVVLGPDVRRPCWCTTSGGSARG